MAKAKRKTTTKSTGTKRAASRRNELSAKDRDVLLALDASFDARPDVAVKVMLADARELAKTSAKDAAALVRGTDLKSGFAKEIDRRAAVLSTSEDAWNAERARRATTAIKKARADAEGLKRNAMRALRYFLRKDDEVQARLGEIAEGSGDTDLVDDCTRLSALLDAHAATLAKAKLGSSPASRLREAGSRLGAVASDQASDTDAGDSIGLRNRAFWSLRRFMDEVRAAGRYAFADDPRRLTKYGRKG